MAALTAETRFREALPSIPVFDSVAAAAALRRRGRRDEGASRVETQRLLELQFLRAAPGAAPPLR